MYEMHGEIYIFSKIFKSLNLPHSLPIIIINNNYFLLL